MLCAGGAEEIHEAAKRHAFAPEVPAQEVGIAVAGAVDEPGCGVDGVEHQDRAWAVIVRAANDGGLQLGGTEYVYRLGDHGVPRPFASANVASMVRADSSGAIVAASCSAECATHRYARARPR